MTRAAFEFALQYAKERKQFGRALIENQAIAFMLADMATEIEATRALIWRALWEGRNGGEFKKAEGSMAKLKAGEVAVKVTEQAIQICGGYGYIRDFPVEKWHRDAKIYTLFEGTSEIQRIVISRALAATSDGGGGAIRRSAAPGRKDRRGAGARIADAALDLFADPRYNVTSVDDIVARAKTSKSAFYEFFKSKEDCFRELLVQEGGALIHDVLADAASGHNHHERLRLGITRFVRLVLRALVGRAPADRRVGGPERRRRPGAPRAAEPLSRTRSPRR